MYLWFFDYRSILEPIVVWKNPLFYECGFLPQGGFTSSDQAVYGPFQSWHATALFRGQHDLNLRPIQSAQNICKLARYKYRLFAASEQCTEHITRGRTLSTTESPSEEPARSNQQTRLVAEVTPISWQKLHQSPGMSYVGPNQLHHVQSHSPSSEYNSADSSAANQPADQAASCPPLVNPRDPPD
jgi:hypothetical protein